MKNIAIIIPARGGSKGIPKKNIYVLDGQPLIDYTIKFAKKLNLEIFISSDDNEILERADIHNVHKIYRPKKLARDNSRVIDTLIHASEIINKSENKFDSLLVLQPTYLSRNKEEMFRAIKIFTEEDIESMVHLTKMREHPAECIKLNNKTSEWNYIVPRNLFSTNRQEFSDDYYYISGNYYIAKIKSLIKNELDKAFFIK